MLLQSVIVLFGFITSCKTVTIEYELDGSTNDSYLHVNCENDDNLEDINDYGKVENNQVTALEFTNCLLSKNAYANVVKTLHLDPSNVTKLSIIRPNTDGSNKAQVITANSFNVFSDLFELVLSGEIEVEENWLENASISLIYLSVLNVTGMKLPPFPTDMQLTDVVLSKGSTKEQWGGCSTLKKILLYDWNFNKETSGKGYFYECHHLFELYVMMYKDSELVQLILKGLESLNKLTVKYVQFQKNLFQKNILIDSSLLQCITISNCNLEAIERNAFAHMKELYYLDLSDNNLVLYNQESAAFLIGHKRLEVLSLNNNPFLFSYKLDGPDYKLLKRNIHIIFQNIKILLLTHTGAKELFFGRMKSLEVLDLFGNDINIFDIQQLPTSKYFETNVDLRNNTNMEIGNYRIDQIRKQLNRVKTVNVYVNFVIDCDCNNAEFANLLKEHRNLKLNGVKCSNGELLKNVLPESMNCEKYQCSECICRENLLQYNVTVSCENKELASVPSVPEATSMLLRANHITTLTGGDFPDSVKFVDLRDNRIGHVNNFTVRALLTGSRQLLLSGNPIVCDCDNYHLLFELRNHKDQVEDFDNLTCVDTDEYTIKDYPLHNLCKQIFYINLAIYITGSVGVLAILILLYCRFKYEISVYFYSKGYCLACYEGDESEYKYDAFISYCHQDEDLVETEIIPMLDEYRLCIHYRDWSPGEWILRQIALSINQSQSTILVLSKNFIDSTWGMQEFRMAHAAKLSEGKQKLIAIVLDDVLERSDLDVELLGFLRSNTYIKWKDPWFFMKLKHALPYKVKKQEERLGVNVDDLKTARDTYRIPNKIENEDQQNE